MLSIGEIAHATGVSRRMLRHREEVGVLAPTVVDTRTGYRRYSRSQVGRVRAITALRAVGFGLDAIGELLRADLTEERLTGLLRSRETELETQIAAATDQLAEVRRRLTDLTRGHRTIMDNLEIGPLPALRLAAVRTHVGDESEIGAAVAELLPDLRRRLAARGITDADVVLTYDGTDDDTIVVTAGTAAAADAGGDAVGLDVVDVPGADRGATVRFDTPPASLGDAWLTLDTALEERSLATTGVYRQTLTTDGGVVLQAPVRDLSR